jgi:hypothetical protein
MKGLDVWELQIKLLAWGSGSDPDGIGSPNMPVRVTGEFDRATRDAVKRFQHALTLPVTGIVNDATFTAIDKEAALWPVVVWQMRCKCADGKNVMPVRCRCEDHPNAGVCTGFGNGRFNGSFLLDNVTLPDRTSLSAEQWDIYDMREYPGLDKALLWTLRGLMRRANVQRLGIAAGYRCWQDNYQSTDGRRWRHRRSTFHLGKAVDIYHDGTCAEYGQNPFAVGTCATCAAIRTVAVNTCGFQARWHQMDRVSVGDVARDGSPPSNPFSLTVSTVRRRDREDDDFVAKYHDSVKPLYPAKAGTFSYPLNIANRPDGLDVLSAPSPGFFSKTETGDAGWYPLGLSRTWHTGIHLYEAAGAEVRAIADGEIVGVRGGEAANAKALGSRNFVLIRHKHKDRSDQEKTWYSLYMHLDAGTIDAASAVPWRKKLHDRTVDHLLFLDPSPVFTHVPGQPALVPPVPSRLVPAPGHAAGERIPTAVAAAAADPRTALDPVAPPNSQVIQLANPASTYAFVSMEGENLAQVVAADAALVNSIANADIIALDPPIRVVAGELLGYVAPAPTDALLTQHGSFLHLEVFSETQILSDDGYKLIDVSAATEVADRKQVVLKMKAAGLTVGLPADVLLQTDIDHDWSPVSLLPERSVVLKTPNQWSLDWKAALAAATPLSFMADAARDTLGDSMNEYRWWVEVSGNNRLPASTTVFHYHPMALLFYFGLA